MGVCGGWHRRSALNDSLGDVRSTFLVIPRYQVGRKLSVYLAPTLVRRNMEQPQSEALNEAASQLDALARNVDQKKVSPDYLGTTLREIAKKIRENGGS